MNPEVSIIIPVCNAEAYIGQCINSIINQTFSDLEIVVVNDNSTDNSFKILQELKLTDCRIIVLNSVSDGGVSTARNIGLTAATGKYIGFADADDWMEPEMIQSLHRSLTQSNADLAICNVYAWSKNIRQIRLKLENEQVSFINPAEIMPALLNFQYDYSNWNKLYRSDILKANSITFVQSMNMYEDLLFNLHYITYISKVVTISEPLYNYRMHETSIMGSSSLNRLTEFNKLLEQYKLFTYSNQLLSEWQFFKKWISSAFYYNLLPALVLRTRLIYSGYFSFVERLSHELRTIHKDMLYFPEVEMSGIQGIKKWLLMNKRYKLFSYIIAVKTVLNKN